MPHSRVGVNAKQTRTSFGKKKAQKFDCIKNNPLAVILTVLIIYQEVIPSMIGVVPITPWELFKALCIGMGVAEFNNILFKASGKTFEFVQANINEKICLVDESSGVVPAPDENIISVSTN